MRLAMVALGGAVGSVLRYLAGVGVHHWAGRAFPYGTLVVNVLGCLIIGVLSIWLDRATSVSPDVRFALLTGVLGGFTTFSAFALETEELARSRSYAFAGLNILLSVGLGLAAVWLGRALALRVLGD
jgi:CrcB protein